MPKNLLFTLIFLLSISIVMANPNWFQEGNANINLPGGNGNILYASNIANTLNSGNITYDSCNMDSSRFQTLATDFDADGITDLVIVKASTIEIWSADCDLWGLITVTAVAMPSITNFNEDTNQEITVLTSDTLQTWEYSSGTETFILVANISSSKMPNSDFLGCYRGDHTTCVAFKTGNKSTLLFNLSSLTTTLNADVLRENASNFSDVTGLAFTNAFPLGIFTPFCWQQNQTGGVSIVSCDIIEHDGTATGKVFQIQVTAESFSSNGVTHLQSAIVKFGNVFRVFTTISVDTSTDGVGGWIHDLDGNELLGLKQTSASHFYSNWMVADQEKNGVQRACIMVLNGADTRLDCYKEGTLALRKWNYTAVLPTYGAVLADFDPDYNILGLATYEGIFYLNNTNKSHLETEFDTGLSFTDAEDGKGVTVASTGISPAFIYTDDDEGFCIRNTIVTSACGDLICQSFETSFSCPQDCAIIELGPGECNTADDCPSVYPFCIGGVCISTDNVSVSCNFNTDCPIDNPICFNNVCVSGISGGIESGLDADGEMKEAIDNAIDMLTGSNRTARFIVGFVIWFFALAGLGMKMGNNPFLITLLMLGITIALVLVTLLPAGFLVLMLIGSVVFLILHNQFSRPSEG